MTEVLDVGVLLNELMESVEARKLKVQGVDAQGNALNWDDPALHDIRFVSVAAAFSDGSPLMRYKLEVLVRPLVKVPVAAEVMEDLLGQMKEQIIAFGRRHSMKGDL